MRWDVLVGHECSQLSACLALTTTPPNCLWKRMPTMMAAHDSARTATNCQRPTTTPPRAMTAPTTPSYGDGRLTSPPELK
ncbi:uncharacterized protein LACBIDRAFT_309760 [Laccaria bicolor S238N-H82]|uniref:Predicted protein n=1 Tax=Laccaria bicolor (strain S238N-H82 / ATCC MYA-4686) TaxID=486041 RepID=B0DT10_LACBS|nr:uncharacterized protein LACBIDRAFT_309760 [Laccaria bicolor S238N-H82]EDR02412.1 predicted protein [Laccaria bicolor S238N-H82]|eukprot:XP_001887089.1 predicted protein [Laccaria bicolor S238N-H82]